MISQLSFDCLNFTESNVEIVRFYDDNLELIAHNVSVVQQFEESGKYEILMLNFLGVSKSVRRIVPYASGRKKNDFLPPVEICDIDRTGDGNGKRFEIEGVLLEPLSWIDSWLIECDRLEISNGKSPFSELS